VTIAREFDAAASPSRYGCSTAFAASGQRPSPWIGAWSPPSMPGGSTPSSAPRADARDHGFMLGGVSARLRELLSLTDPIHRFVILR